MYELCDFFFQAVAQVAGTCFFKKKYFYILFNIVLLAVSSGVAYSNLFHNFILK